jgi:signal transduction histidine kinase
LRPLAEQPATRAEALLRIARLQPRLNHPDAALAAYDRMSRETAIGPDGVPYALLAADARCDLLGAAAAEPLRVALLAGRWPVNRETFAYYWSESNRIRHTSDAPPKDALEFAELVSRLHEQWQQAVLIGANSSGRETQPDASPTIWYATPARLTALSAPAGWLGAGMKMPANAADIRGRFAGSGAPAAVQPYVLRSLAEAQLGGKLEFSSIAGVPNRGTSRALWLAGVALMLVLVLAGAYAMYRGVGWELRVAQLQSDFVSAVSHEFRSPLTSLRGIAELLAHDRLADEGRKHQSYAFLERETGRLQRLVEDLLDFGRTVTP